MTSFLSILRMKMERKEALKKQKLVREGLLECVDPDETMVKILSKRPLKIYWGTAPTGAMHIGYLVPLLKIAQLLMADCEIKILIADLHAFLDSQKTPLKRLEARTKYYQVVIETVLHDIFGVDLDNITFVKGREYQLQLSYTMDMYKMASVATLHQAQKSGSEVVKASENPNLTGLLYPILQALDEEYLGVDAQLGGIDQRKIFMFAREMLPKIGYKKRIHLMTPMMSRIRNLPMEAGTDSLEPKMSSSYEDSTKVGILDSKSQITRKIRHAYCLSGNIDDNCLIELMELCIFPILNYLNKDFHVPRADKHGGPVSFSTFYEFKANFFNQNLHPMDLKAGISDFLFHLLAPLREKFAIKEMQQLLKDAYN